MPFISTIGGGSAQGFGRQTSKSLEEFFTQYDYTGGDQQFNIPSGLAEVEAYIYGPGGGAGAQYGTQGGAGGFTYGKINTSSGGTLDIIVGQGGSPGTQSNGSGGGYSGVFQSSWGSNWGTDRSSSILVAGGGGGGGNAAGGAGGGQNGQKGNNNSAGNGGSQGSGGSYYGNGGGSCTSTCTGNEMRGGTGCGGAEGSGGVGWPCQKYGGNWCSAAGGNGCNAAGGGSGYYGGGGGGSEPNGGPGGGGSGYVGGHGSYSVSSAQTWTGSYQTPPNELSTGLGAPYDNGTISRGTSNNAGHGRVVLKYLWSEQL